MKQTSGTFEVVRIYDPAIDHGAEGAPKAVAKYAVERDLSLLRYVDPAVAVPMIFVCKRLTKDQRRHVTDAANEAEQFRRAFLYGVEAVKGYTCDDGQVVTLYPKRPNGASMKMDEDELDRFGEDDVHEIGLVIKAQSFLARGLPLRLPVLVSSQAAYETVLILFAERKPASETKMETQST